MKKLHIIIALMMINICVGNAQVREFMRIGSRILPPSDIDSITYTYWPSTDGTDHPMVYVYTKSRLQAYTFPFVYSDMSLVAPDTVSEHIDLGLSVEWATKDFNASSFGEAGEVKRLDSSIIEGSSNDPVTAKMGYPWRMPVKAEVEELKGLCEYSMPKPYHTYYIHGNGNILVLPGMSSWSDTNNPYWNGTQNDKSVRIRPVYAPTPVELINLTTDSAIYNGYFHVLCSYTKVPAIQKSGIELRYPDYPHLDGQYVNGAKVMFGTTIYYRPYLLVGGQYIYGEEKSIEVTDTASLNDYLSLMSELYTDDNGELLLSKADTFYLPSQKAWQKFFEDHSGLFADSVMSQMTREMKYFMTSNWESYIKGLSAEKKSQIEASSKLVNTTDGIDIYVLDEVPDEFVNSIERENVMLYVSRAMKVSSDFKSNEYGNYDIYTINSKSNGRLTFSSNILMAGKYHLALLLGPCLDDNDMVRVSGYLSYTNQTKKHNTIDLYNQNENAVDEKGESMYGTKNIDIRYNSDSKITTAVFGSEIDIESLSRKDITFILTFVNMNGVEGYSNQLSLYGAMLIPIKGDNP